MPSEFAFAVVAPDRSVVETNVISTVIPGLDGYFGVWHNHAPMISALRPGVLEYTTPTNDRHFVVIDGGFAEVTGARVTILADRASLLHEIDVVEAEKLLEEARKALRGENSTVSTDQATAVMEQAIVRIRAAKAKLN